MLISNSFINYLKIWQQYKIIENSLSVRYLKLFEIGQLKLTVVTLKLHRATPDENHNNDTPDAFTVFDSISISFNWLTVHNFKVKLDLSVWNHNNVFVIIFEIYVRCLSMFNFSTYWNSQCFRTTTVGNLQWILHFWSSWEINYLMK